MATQPKLQGQFTLRSSVTLTVAETGTGAQTKNVAIAAGDYYLSSATSLVTTLQTGLNAAGLGGTYTVTLSDTTDNASGLITIAATGTISTFGITWGSDTSVRDALGYTGNVSGSLSYAAPNQAKYLWLPFNNRYAPMGAVSTSVVGVPVADGTMTVSPSGKSKALTYNTRYVDTIEWRMILGRKALRGYETSTNESLQSFWEQVISQGQPFRYHPLRSDNSTYVTYRAVQSGMSALNLQALRPDWSAATALYNWRTGVISYV